MTSDAAFPICLAASCKKNATSDRVFWKREIDHQYQYYLATLRAERDAKYLTQEHSALLSRIASAEAANVACRKQIRILQMEMFVMFQRNAHDSYVIDGLHEANHESDETDQLTAQTRRRLRIATFEGDQEDCLIAALNEEIALLRRKDGEDVDLRRSIRPLEEQLKVMLGEEKMKNHQQAMQFKRELESVLNEFQGMNAHLEEGKGMRSAEIVWAGEIFSTIFGRKTVDPTPADSDTSSIQSSQETEQFDVSAVAESPENDLEEGLQALKREHSDYIAQKELLDLKNLVNLHLIYDSYHRITEIIENLSEEYTCLFHVSAEVAFIKEYVKRLEDLRRKRDIKNTDENMPRVAQRLDHMSLILSSLLSEKAWIEGTLRYFTSTLKEDFEAHSVTLQKTEEIFVTASTSGEETSDIQSDE